MEDNFSKFVQDAIDHIPKQYQEKMKHVAILVEDGPTEEQRKSLGLRECDALFGLYEGVPLTQRGGYSHAIPPDRITIFRQPMTQLFPDENDLKKQIYKTLWHEVAHFFGLNHDQIHQAAQSKRL